MVLDADTTETETTTPWQEVNFLSTCSCEGDFTTAIKLQNGSGFEGATRRLRCSGRAI